MPAVITSQESADALMGRGAMMFPGDIGHIDLDANTQSDPRRVLFVCCDSDGRGINVFLMQLPKSADLSDYKENFETIKREGDCIIAAVDETNELRDRSTGYFYTFKHFTSMVQGQCVVDFI